MHINRPLRIQPKNPDRDVYDAAAALIAVNALRKQVRRWLMTTANIDRLIGRDVNGTKIAKLQNALADYGIVMFRANDLRYAFLFREFVERWTSFGLHVTDEERYTPDVYALEEEIEARAHKLYIPETQVDQNGTNNQEG